MTDIQKNCIEYMVLGFMGIDDACAIAGCTPEDFETPECKAYAKQYEDEFDAYQDYMRGLFLAKQNSLEVEYQMCIDAGCSPAEALREWDLV